MNNKAKTCLACKETFELTSKDLQFYTQIEVAEPSHCYFCRMLRRLSYRNERNLYHRKCSFSGKQIISAFSDSKPFPVYENEVWWSDQWSALDYGRDYDFSKSFFEQFLELRNKVPRLAMQQQKPIENSSYCNCASQLKDCYLVFSTNHCQDCYYGSWVNNSENCLDNLNIDGCKICYQCIGCRDCYNLKYSRDCVSCFDSYFLRDCVACSNCIGCNSLNNQEYCIFNKKVGKAEYKKFISQINFGSSEQVSKLAKRIEEALGVTTVKEKHGVKLENCSGDYLRNSKNLDSCFECDFCEDCSFCMCIQNSKVCMDFSYWGGDAELIYESQACGYGVYNLRFCNLCWSSCRDLTYCDHCFSTQNCFGCVGLKNQKFCILNKQYSEAEYEVLVSKIIRNMKKTGEWGEFFPISLSVFAYNESLAAEHFPLSKKEALDKGYQWQDQQDQKKMQYLGDPYIIDDDIKNVDQSICTKILKCEESAKPFKVVEPELKYYQENNIPIPRLCPEIRHLKRLFLRNPRILWNRKCAACNSNIQTSYAPARPERVLCEDCYSKEIFK